MPYTKEQIRQKAYALEAAGAPPQDIEKFVRLATQEAGIFPVVPKEKGFLRQVAEGIARPVAELAVSGANATIATGKLAMGDIKGANASLGAKRKLPFLGETKAAFTGDETFGEGVKKIAGYGLDVGSNVVGGGGAVNVAKSGLKGLVRQGAKQGAKSGALAGVMYGSGSTLEQGGTLGQAAVEGIKGGIAGGIGGGIVGTVSGALGAVTRKAIKNAKMPKAEKIAKKEIQDTLEIVAPEMNKAEKIAALQSNRGQKNALGKIKIAANKRDKEVAKAVQGIVSKDSDFVQNIANIDSAITNEAEFLKQNLAQNNVIFNRNQLGKKLREVEKPPLVASDNTMSNAYELAQSKFMQFVEEQPKNMTGLLEARQKFDQWVKQSFPGIFESENWKPLHTALRQMRSTANDFIAEKLPNGSTFRESLKKQNLMYEAIENISGKSYRDIGTTPLQRFGKKFPTASKVIKYGGSGVAGAGAAGVASSLLD